MKRVIVVLVSLAVLGGFGLLGYRFIQNRQVSTIAVGESKRQEPEVQQCRERLAQFHQALSSYKNEHKGALPANLEALIPKYVKPDLLVCPTAAYWIGKKMSMEQGALKVKDKTYPMTYGARWLTGGYARSMKRDGERAPLIVCESHGEALFKVAYKLRPPLGAFSEEQRVKWVPEIRDVKALAVLTNGEVVELVPADI